MGKVPISFAHSLVGGRLVGYDKKDAIDKSIALEIDTRPIVFGLI